MYGWKPGKAHHWSGGRKQTSIIDLAGSVFAVQRDGSCLVRVGNDALIIRGTDLTVEAVEPTTLYHDRPKSSVEHPTMKPVGLVSRMLKNSTRHGEIVLDPFGGSGSTLIACEMLGRCARVVELEPRFVDVTIRRWREFTGQIARLDGTGAAFHEVEEARQSSLQLTG